MWFLQTDILIRLILAAVIFAVATFVLSKFLPKVRTAPYLLILDLALLFYVSEKLAVFYALYTLGTWVLQLIMRKAVKYRKAIFVILCFICAVPFFYVRFSRIWSFLPWEGLPVYVSLIGFAYNMLKAIDGIFYVYYTDEKIPILTYANFILFFPTITAGPIFRFRDFKAGYDAPKTITGDAVEKSVKRFILGMFKKIVVVSVLGILTEKFTSLGQHIYTSLMLIVLSYFTLYFDLSGYSDIAVALGNIMGITVPENFKNPFSAATFTQFWRKWHVTLSDWIREHIFVVVNGKKLNKYISALIGMCTMIVMSLWHEFSWVSIACGVYMGLFLVIENIFKLSTFNRRKAKKSVFYMRCFLTNFFFAVNTLPYIMSWDEIVGVLKGLVTL